MPRLGVRAGIFDFDGVIADTEGLHFSTLRDTLAEEGIGVSEAEYARTYIVLDDRDSIRTAFKQADRELGAPKLRALMARKAERFDDAIQTGVPLFPGAADFIRAMAADMPLAIASGALKAEIVAILSAYRLDGVFTEIVGADDVTRGKPHPETYLRAYESLRLTLAGALMPEECVVIEDTVNGVDGAKAAGMRVIAVTNSYPASRLGHADAVVSTLEGMSAARVRELLR